MRRLAPLLLSTMLSSHAFALDQCKPSSDDAQARICTYSPTQRYVVSGLIGYPVNLKFGPTEVIKRSDFAYTGLDEKGKPTQTWKGPGGSKQGDDGKSLPEKRYLTNLPIWPFQAGRSALIVITALPDGTERPYLFDLNAHQAADNCDKGGLGCPDDKTTTTTLTFAYPADVAAATEQASIEKKQAAVAAWQVRQAKLKEDVAVARLKTDAFYGQRSFAYQAKADPKYKFLAPSEVSDNGWLTEMQWPENVQIPTVTIIDPVTGEERVAAISQQGRMQIISTTAEWFRLRLGPKAVMDIHNLAWKAERPNPGTGTTSPDVVREVIYQGAKP